jgi:cellulose synthase/poly-beta-1,6-N-acetylglucosamine synthase-like glycosyltransferase
MACAAAAAEADVPADAAALASLITPARNAGRWLGECAASVVAQTHVGPLEWVVFDDGSSDDTRAVLEAWRVRLAAAAATRMHTR